MAVGLSARGSSLSLGSERHGIMDFTLRHDPGLIGFGTQSSGVCAKAELPRNTPTQVAPTRLAMGQYILRSLAFDEHTSAHTNPSATSARSHAKPRSIPHAHKHEKTKLLIRKQAPKNKHK